MDRDAAGTYETQFVSQSDDGDTLYNVEKILGERGRKYLVQWEGIDPETKKKWKPDWVQKTDCTDDLIADWKREKETRKRLAVASKRSSSASGSITSRAPATKITSTLRKPKSKTANVATSPPVSEARSNSSANTAASKLGQKSRFVIQIPVRAGTKRPRESEAAPSAISPVKRLRLNGPPSPLPASPFDNDDGGAVGKKQTGPVTYKKRKPALGKSPLSKKAVGPLATKTSKMSARNTAISSRAKPVSLLSPKNASKKGTTTHRDARSDEDNTATEDEDSDPQLPERRKPNPAKAATTTRPSTRSQKPVSPEVTDPGELDPETFVRPHPTTCARTRPLPTRDPAANRANQRNLGRSIRDDIPERVLKSLTAKNMFPIVVTGSREKPSMNGEKPDMGLEEFEDADDLGLARGNNIEAEEHPKPTSPVNSGPGSTHDKPASPQGDRTGDGDGKNLDGDGEQIMSSVESENAPVLSQEKTPNHPFPSHVDTTVPVLNGSQPQSQSQGNSSKGTVVPDSQAPVQNLKLPIEGAEPHTPASPIASPPRPSVALSKSKSSGSGGIRKLRPSEMLKLGKGITIKPRVSVARTESTLIETVPTEFAQSESESEYDPHQSKPPSQSGSSSSSSSSTPSNSGESNEPPEPTPHSSAEESQSETDEVDSNEDDDEAEVGRDGPSFRTRSQSLSQTKPKYQPPWNDGTPAKVKPLDLTGQVNALLPRDEDNDEQEPIPTSSPSLGGGRMGSMEPDNFESPTRHRKVVEVMLPSPTRSSQRSASQTSKVASQPHKGPTTQEEPITQETILEPEIQPSPAWPKDDFNEEVDGQDGSPAPNDLDQSLVHAMEIDELLAGDTSHQIVEEDLNSAARNNLGALDTSVIDLSNTTMDASQSVLVLDPDQSRADYSMQSVQPITEPPLPSQPDSQIPTLSSSLPQLPKPSVPVLPASLPSLLSESSQSQQLPNSQPLALGSQVALSQQQVQPESQPAPLSQSQPPSQPPPQDHTHSSIEEMSSWSLPPPGQVPRPPETISSFTLTNPSTRAPRTSGEHPPSSNPFPPSTNGDNGPGVLLTQSSIGFEPPSTFGPVPDIGTEIFRRGQSPGSDIDQFDSPPKVTPVFLRERSTVSPGSRRSREATPGFRFGAASPGPVDSSGQSQREREMDEALKEAEVKLAARDHRIVELTGELEQLAAEKSRAAAIFRDNMAQSESIVQQQQEAYAVELAEHAKTIANLQLQLAAAQSQHEIAESQRATSFEQYRIASDGAKTLADENKELNDRVHLLEKQVTAGLQQWQRGFESNVEQKERELKQLQAQLDLEREIRARTDGRDVRRRAAEWYELKKRVEDLEAENLEVEQEVNTIRKREQALRHRERELELRVKTLESLAAPPSQSQRDRGLSQDDMQTETFLSDRSAVLADLDGPAGEDFVWMCTYRDASDKLCGKAFDTMGLLMTHVLDAEGHKVDAGCQCR